MNPIVVKFGGSSLATAGQFEKVAAIIRENPGRRYVVASAPGKRFSGDTKVTDLLYRCYDAACAGQDFAPVLDEIRQRFADIISELQLQVDLAPDFAAIEAHLRTSPQRDYMASRGEYLNSRLLAAYLGFSFVDAAQMVLFRADGSFDAEATNTAIGHALVSIDRAVIPGFYGAMPDGTIHTFSRGGSDVTGSIVARAVGAELYENWTDVSGVLAADPRIIEHPHVVDYITYRELRELSYMGASVLHEDAVFPVRRANIPINIRNTNRPQDPGTFIVPTLPANAHKRKVTGIAGHKGFSSVYVEKSMMNGEIGFVAHLLQIFADHGISFEHCPSGIDTVSIIVDRGAGPGARGDPPPDPGRAAARPRQRRRRARPHRRRRPGHDLRQRHRRAHLPRDRRREHQHPHDRPGLLRAEHHHRRQGNRLRTRHPQPLPRRRTGHVTNI